MEQSNIISGSDAEKCGLSVVNPDTGLTSNQEQCAIMLASGISITEVSKQINTSRTTIYRWLGSLAFQCFFNSMKLDAKNYIEGSLFGLKEKALDSIKACLESNNDAIKLKASMWIVDKISQIKVGEFEIRNALQEKSQELEKWGQEDRYKKKLAHFGLSDEEAHLLRKYFERNRKGDEGDEFDEYDDDFDDD